MILIPDDPIVRCMERTGYPPWIEDDEDGEEWWDDGDVYYGNSSEEF